MRTTRAHVQAGVTFIELVVVIIILGILAATALPRFMNVQTQAHQAAVDGAEEQMKALGDPIDMFEHAYGRMPSYLKEQKEAFAREVAAITEEKNSG